MAILAALFDISNHYRGHSTSVDHREDSPLAHSHVGFFEVAPVIASAGVDEDGGDMLSFLWSIHDGLDCSLTEWWKICERLGEQNGRIQAARY